MPGCKPGRDRRHRHLPQGVLRRKISWSALSHEARLRRPAGCVLRVAVSERDPREPTPVGFASGVSETRGVRPRDGLLAVGPKQPRRRRERCCPGLLLPDVSGRGGSGWPGGRRRVLRAVPLHAYSGHAGELAASHHRQQCRLRRRGGRSCACSRREYRQRWGLIGWTWRTAAECCIGRKAALR